MFLFHISFPLILNIFTIYFFRTALLLLDVTFLAFTLIYYRHFLVGPDMGEEFEVTIEKGKTLTIKTLTPGLGVCIKLFVLIVV